MNFMAILLPLNFSFSNITFIRIHSIGRIQLNLEIKIAQTLPELLTVIYKLPQIIMCMLAIVHSYMSTVCIINWYPKFNANTINFKTLFANNLWHIIHTQVLWSMDKTRYAECWDPCSDTDQGRCKLFAWWWYLDHWGYHHLSSCSRPGQL